MIVALDREQIDFFATYWNIISCLEPLFFFTLTEKSSRLITIVSFICLKLIKSKRRKKFLFLANEEWTLIKKFIQIQIRSLFIENNIFLLIDDYLMAFIC